ncbi:cytochrome c [Telmatospirillum sp. J64-1]|uniref:c-type cytochrome n=1 Tax=Telmatospirillum sp. J64-1 TaxID=2502183 RepID=UPI001C8F96D2|nr:cytochrome c [Telmatospirillum sp. J64-1]
MTPALWLLAALLLAVPGWAQQPEQEQQQEAAPEPETPSPMADSAVLRGEYVFRAGSCNDCHTRQGGPFLGGGVALETDFGTFYGPNISPDPQHGIGNWSSEQFIAAFREGRAPDGRHYYPSFPYTSFTHVTDQDLLDLRAYLMAQEPVPEAAPPHELNFPFNWRFLMVAWKWLFFEPGVYQANPQWDEQRNRGAYLVLGLGHCGECHTDRNRFGAMDRDRHLAGTVNGPDNRPVPNITPDPETGIGHWTEDDIAFFLSTGVLPDGDVVGSMMARIVRESTAHLTPEDQDAIAAYLKEVPPIQQRIGGN